MRRQVRYLYLRFLRLRSTPAALARGFAVGVFAGMFPFFGAQTLLSVLAAVLIKGNKIMAAAGTWVSNPLTYVPIYAFNFQVGRWLLHESVTLPRLDGQQSIRALFQASSDVAIALLLGCFIVACVASVVAYVVMLYLARRLRRLRS